VPIFFIGINVGESVRRKDTIDGQGIWMLWIMFVMTFASCYFLEQVRHGQFPLFVERMLYIPLTITSILIFNRILRRMPSWFNSALAWVGSLSLECYLVHLHFVLDYLPKDWTYWPTFLACTIITLPLAWILMKIVTFISKQIQSICKI
jgi:peptidoglycan/LPS O-acetylase OafA/YrhL